VSKPVSKPRLMCIPSSNTCAVGLDVAKPLAAAQKRQLQQGAPRSTGVTSSKAYARNVEKTKLKAQCRDTRTRANIP